VSKVTLTESEIAALVDGDLFISTGAEVSGINSLDQSQPHEASFLGNEKYYNDFLSTKAGLVLAPSILQEAPEGVGIIHVPNPSVAFAKLADHLSGSAQPIEYAVSPHAIISGTAQFTPDKVLIMAGAYIGENVTLGDGVIIHPGVVIADDVTVGDNTLIYPNCVIREQCEIGANAILQPGCVIGSDGYGFDTVDGKHRKVAQIGIVVIEDDVEVGANSTIDRARFGRTTIKQGTKIDNLVQIAHNATIGEHNLVVAQVGIAGSASTGDYVTIGAQTGIAGHLHVGDNVKLAAKTGVTKSLSPDGIYQGYPARPIKSVSKSKAIVNRLPKLLDRIKVLEEKIAKLEGE